MARKNNRAAPFVPADVTPIFVREPANKPRPLTSRERQSLDRFRDIKRRERSEAQIKARVEGAIDWSVCIVPGCGAELVAWGRYLHPSQARRDSSIELPICYEHMAVIWHRAIGGHSRDAELQEAVADIRDRVEARTQEQRKIDQAAFIARTDGDIYFVRLNELIKVGWTRDLHGRLKSYGASVEVLVYYPATRDDETNLHRQLRPALAKGREWYTDGPIIQRFIADALASHGQPNISIFWTKPKKQIVAGKRHR